MVAGDRKAWRHESALNPSYLPEERDNIQLNCAVALILVRYRNQPTKYSSLLQHVILSITKT